MLDMSAHPEGGWYVETFRDADGPDGREAGDGPDRHSSWWDGALPGAPGVVGPVGSGRMRSELGREQKSQRGRPCRGGFVERGRRRPRPE
jgi:hypothetical protein